MKETPRHFEPLRTKRRVWTSQCHEDRMEVIIDIPQECASERNFQHLEVTQCLTFLNACSTAMPCREMGLSGRSGRSARTSVASKDVPHAHFKGVGALGSGHSCDACCLSVFITREPACSVPAFSG